ncbi:MAG: hypothetical protein KC547_22805, partial [Anaerolineae bacterium]|nr:hypothetical protein [Anaerolineae bacterium]
RGVIALAVLAGMIVAGLVSFSIINGLFGSTNPTPIPTITVAQAETETLELAAQTLLQIEPTTTQSPIVSLTPRPATTQPPIVSLTPRPATTQPPIVSLTPRPATTQAAFTNGSAQSVAGIDVFALCDNPEFAQPAPAISAGSSVDIYFAWFAATRRQIEDHVASASYDIRLNGIVLPVGEPAFIRPAAAGGYEAYWYVTTGQLAPGEYQISSRVTWRETVFDGVTSFGPGTSIQEETGTCTFQVN